MILTDEEFFIVRRRYNQLCANDAPIKARSAILTDMNEYIKKRPGVLFQVDPFTK